MFTSFLMNRHESLINLCFTVYNSDILTEIFFKNFFLLVGACLGDKLFSEKLRMMWPGSFTRLSVTTQDPVRSLFIFNPILQEHSESS